MRQAVCPQCRARGPARSTDRDAVRDWNRVMGDVYNGDTRPDDLEERVAKNTGALGDVTFKVSEMSTIFRELAVLLDK